MQISNFFEVTSIVNCQFHTQRTSISTLKISGYPCQRSEETRIRSNLHVIGTTPLAPFLLKVIQNTLFNFLDSLVGHNADGKFPNDLGRDDCLAARGRECPFDSMQRQGRETPPVLQEPCLMGIGRGCKNALIFLVFNQNQ